MITANAARIQTKNANQYTTSMNELRARVNSNIVRATTLDLTELVIGICNFTGYISWANERCRERLFGEFVQELRELGYEATYELLQKTNLGIETVKLTIKW